MVKKQPREKDEFKRPCRTEVDRESGGGKIAREEGGPCARTQRGWGL